jgi:exosortase/archaeosortase family protein
VIAVAAPDRAVAPRRDGRALLASLALALGALWALELLPALGALLAPLNVLTAQLTAAMLAAVGLPVARVDAVLVHAGGFACVIDHACTALGPVAVLAALILPRAASRRARATGVLLGTVLLVGVNQLRLISLVWLGVQAPDLFQFAHVWLWPALLVVTTVGYWWAWARMTRR